MNNWSTEIILIFNLKWKSLLVLSNATTHKKSIAKDKINECESALSVMPSDLAWRLQPLGISINICLKKV